ncbi:MAG: hypothetical protein HON68_06400 [Gammaproteobacteria bacterium]|jgi:hypothetical protein|nr:hypothetical protein [Gammaproteobacteria bacterium]MBT3490423.1 hypothetical protein [Gammaproteobacteria bacterium]MBT3718111.1 hypothetical protein [Gammaproteobacteria bacterium]MBT3845575.1 hypothetical protein [Gammaproteobacteria bacterium]MBT3893313.1 hypothetical protein [Gammaproteobacteria bacterium]
MPFNILQFNNASSKLGFRIGRQNLSQVHNSLSKSHATFEKGLGYKGYSNTLPSIRIQSYSEFNQFGTIHDAWLEFASNQKLYNIFVEWTENGSTFRQLKTMCDKEYGNAITKSIGFITEFKYFFSETEITLVRDIIGPSDQHIVSLSYTYLPLKEGVRSAKHSILEKIKKKMPWETATYFG